MNDMSDSSPASRPPLQQLAAKVLASYDADPRIRHTEGGPIPDQQQMVKLLDMIRDLLFPGFFSERPLDRDVLEDHVLTLLAAIRESMELLIAQALAYQQYLEQRGSGDGASPAVTAEATLPQARQLTDAFLDAIPELREILATDVQAAYDGDPAARNTDETVFCYPGVFAVFTYRVAQRLQRLGVPLVPRLLSEHAHSEVGIDIHPGASIGRSFFIDHGTGVVIGETTHIGDRCKLYQGVTLGAMSFPRDETGRLIRGTKRHPTLEDDVTIYSNTTILGGNTIVGAGSIVGGSVFLTKSVPPGHYVTRKALELRFRSAEVHNRLTMQSRETPSENPPK
ncbi:MAG: hypothetical protein WD294_00460 [Phycisphaeraceae bacterium]